MTYFTLLSIVAVLAALFSFILITVDLTSRPQPMKVMRPVWMLTGLWAGIIALWAYFSFGRTRKDTDGPIGGYTDPTQSMNMPGSMPMSDHEKSDHMKMDGSAPMEMSMKGLREMRDMPGMNSMQEMDMSVKHPRWQSIALSTLHCGAGCTLADLTGEWFTSIVPVSIGGSLIAGSWVLDYILALIFGIWFQYMAIRSMEAVSATKAISRAIKADFLSLTAWQVGMYGWMALVYFVFFASAPLTKDSWTFWFMMQIAMGVGFLFAYPMNALLIRVGIKKSM